MVDKVRRYKIVGEVEEEVGIWLLYSDELEDRYRWWKIRNNVISNCMDGKLNVEI